MNLLKFAHIPSNIDEKITLNDIDLHKKNMIYNYSCTNKSNVKLFLAVKHFKIFLFIPFCDIQIFTIDKAFFLKFLN